MRGARALGPLVALPLVLALALLPAAQAHFEDFNPNSATLRAGPYNAYFEPRPAMPFAGATTTLVAQIAPAASGTPMRGGEANVTVTVAGPGPFAQTRTMSPDGTGYFVATVVFPGTGIYSATLRVKDLDSAEEGEATTSVEVFPDLPIRIRPIDTALDVYANESTTYDLEIVNASVLTRDDRVQDLTARFEHWADDHTEKISEQVIEGTRTGPGTWRFVATADSSGMHHIRFASSSGGFNYDETPPLHVYASERPEGSAPADERESPAGGPALAGLAVALAVALARIGRRKG